MSDWLHSGPVSPIWPVDRFEVRSIRPNPGFGAADRYASATAAYEAAMRMRDSGLATQIQVIRIEDGVVLFDLTSGVEMPLEAW
ncbi:hypothetical protein Psi02_09830 [Planotetraspora silvatica]|uniref:Uncharacterized protein n=1 Tax=Planotetraspora silvatica TaxID=234614 RepID=A0A8J3UFD7_9ACTN|nr:hypothetical protein [Planotetraspora silvatica]GII44559.1 hypothetical protein Psi02_09830 [Planotetraspora silvatica]